MAAPVHFNDLGKRLAYRVAVLMRTARLHSAGNQALDYSLRGAVEAANTFHAFAGDIQLVGEEGQVHVNDTRLVVDRSMQTPITEMNRALRGWSVGGLEVRGHSTPEHWRALLALLEATPAHTGAEPDPAGAERLNERLPPTNPLRLLPVMRLQRGLGGGGGGEGRSVQVAATSAVQLYVRTLSLAGAWLANGGGAGVPVGLSRAMMSFVELCVTEPRQALMVTRLKSEAAYALRHPVNTAILSIALGRRVGLQRGALMDLSIAALCADLGMLEVPEAVRNSPEKLDEASWALLRRHTLVGARLALSSGRLTLTTRRRMRAALEHHRGYDRAGYPALRGNPEPHLFARIIAVTEAFDAMTTDRPWRPGLLPEEALESLLEQSGRTLDPVLVAELVNLLGRYPLGCAVLLSTGELGVVFAGPPDPRQPERPLVRLLVDRQGQRVAQAVIVDLRERDAAGRTLRSVLRTVDPAALGVDTTRALLG